MRKLISYLFMSLDGVIEAPDRFLRPDLYGDLDPLDDTLAEQDTVLMGRKTYEEWAQFWPTSDLEPFASFINNVPKHVVSGTLDELGWANSTLLDGDLVDGVRALKDQPSKAIGLHGSVSLVHALLAAGLIDELKLVLCPVVAGSGPHLLARDGEPIHLDLDAANVTPGGLQYLVYRPRRES